MISIRTTVVRAVAVLCVVAAGSSFAVYADDPPASETEEQPQATDHVLDLSRLSIPVKLPGLKDGDGDTFGVGHSMDDAWAAKVAASNPRSPAVEDGMVVVGSGGGSKVYGYDAESGKRNWTASSKDAGISSIVISAGFAYYTTYSCTLERVQVSNGKNSYSKYLAPTVDCAATVDNDIVATAYRSGGAWNVAVHGAERGGKRWAQSVGTQGVLTAPVIHDEQVFVACADGKVSKLDSHTGRNHWTADLGAVSAPVTTSWGLLVTTTWDGKSEPSAKQAKPRTAEERKRRERETVTDAEAQTGTLAAAKDRRIALIADLEEQPEGKSGGELAGPRVTLDFQGLRPGVSSRHVVFAYAGQVICVDPQLGEVLWNVKITDDKSDFVRPVCHEGLVIAATTSGTVCALEESTGALIWSYEFTHERFLAEPAVEKDRLFITTASGKLVSMPIGIYSIDTGRHDAGDEIDQDAAAAYWKLQKAFRKVRDIVRGVEKPEPRAPQPGPDARNGNGPDDSAPDNGAGDREAVRPREDEAEELTKGQWERREDRKAERAKAEGKRYERKPYKRE